MNHFLSTISIRSHDSSPTFSNILKNPRSIGNKLAYFALLVLEKPFGLMPTSWMWRLGAGLGWVTHKLARKRRAIVAANLKIVHPEFSEQEIQALTKKVFRYSCANLASSINTSCISSKRVADIVEIKGQENITNLDPDKGCIAIVFHMGNWEILTRISPLLKTEKPMAAMFRPLNNIYINDHITASREKDGMRLFSRKRGLIEANRFIRNGGMLGILSDQHAGAAGVKIPLFGKETSITPLPAILAQKYDCPIITIVLTTKSPGKWIADYQAPFYIPKGLTKEQATAHLIPVLEKVMHDHCEDIFWLHDRWKMKHELSESR